MEPPHGKCAGQIVKLRFSNSAKDQNSVNPSIMVKFYFRKQELKYNTYTTCAYRNYIIWNVCNFDSPDEKVCNTQPKNSPKSVYTVFLR